MYSNISLGRLLGLFKLLAKSGIIRLLKKHVNHTERSVLSRADNHPEVFFYHTSDGRMAFYVVKFIESGKEKAMTHYVGLPPNDMGIPQLRKTPYNIKMVLDRKVVFFVNTEKDADYLISKDIPATTINGGIFEAFSPSNHGLEGKLIILLPTCEPDQIKLAYRFAELHNNVGKLCCMIQLRCQEPYGDISEWYRQGNSTNGLISQVNAALKPLGIEVDHTGEEIYGVTH